MNCLQGDIMKPVLVALPRISVNVVGSADLRFGNLVPASGIRHVVVVHRGGEPSLSITGP